MLWSIAALLVILWTLGLISGYTMDGFVHVLIVLALAAVVFGALTGRRMV